jgi:hypothetical protein
VDARRTVPLEDGRGGTLAGMTDDTARSIPTILAELAEVRRHLHDAPPHHGSGTRDALTRRQGELERELAALRSAADPMA